MRGGQLSDLRSPADEQLAQYSEWRLAMPGAGTVSRRARASLSDDRRSAHFTPDRPHRKFARHVITHRVAEVGSSRIGFIQLRQGRPVWIAFPAHLLKVLDKTLALVIDKQPLLTSIIAQHGVNA